MIPLQFQQQQSKLSKSKPMGKAKEKKKPSLIHKVFDETAPLFDDFHPNSYSAISDQSDNEKSQSIFLEEDDKIN